MVGTPALQVAQKVGVMNDAGEVGVLVIDAEGEEVPAIVNLTIKGNALRTIHRKIHRCGGVVLSSDFPATPSPCASRRGQHFRVAPPWSGCAPAVYFAATDFECNSAGWSFSPVMTIPCLSCPLGCLAKARIARGESTSGIERMH